MRAVASVFLVLVAAANAYAASADGSPFDWSHDNVKRLDGRNDAYWFGDGRDRARDLVAFYYTEEGGFLNFRIDVYELLPGDEGSADYYIAMDFAPGGWRGLPDDLDGDCPLGDGWDMIVAIYDTRFYNIYLPGFPGLWTDNSLMAGHAFNADDDMIECSVRKPWTFPWGGTVKFEVFSTKGYTTNGDGEIGGRPDICDAMVDQDRGWSDGRLDGFFTSNDRVGSAKIVFVQHGNQGITWTDVLRGRQGFEAQSGFDELLRAHDWYDVRLTLHLSGTIIAAAQWYDPAFNRWVRQGVADGRYEIMTSAFGQHIMPFVHDDMNDWSIGKEKDIIWSVYGYDANTAWVPERTWEYPGSDGVSDWIGDNFTRQHVDAVVLDDGVHGRNVWDKTKPYRIRNGPIVFFRSGWLSDSMHGGDMTTVKNAFIDFANDRDQERVLIYADDMEMAAQVGNWQAIMGWALTNYWETCRYVAAHPWVQDTKLDNILTWGWRIDTIDIAPGTHPSVGGASGYGGWGWPYGRNAWYNHWASYVPAVARNGRNYGQLWNDAHWAVIHAPQNAFKESAWLTLMVNLFETGWHEGLGGPISGWEHNYSAHVKNAIVHARAAEWLAWPQKRTEAFWWDMDGDGANELVMRNDKLMAVFEEAGARACWIFDDRGEVVTGNDIAFWEGTTGDYNDANHVGVLSDVWDGYQSHEHRPYAIQIDRAAPAGTAVVKMTSGHLEKTVTQRAGERFLDVVYRTPGFVHVRGGFSPGLLNLVYEGQASIERLYGRNGEYSAFRNKRTGTIGGFVLGPGGAYHLADGTTTLLKWDEIWGWGPFRVLIYAGPGTEADLQALAAQVRHP